MIKLSKGTKFFLATLTIFVGVLLVWFSNGGDRDSDLERPEGVRPGFSTWGHVKNQGADPFLPWKHVKNQGADPFLKHDSNGLHQLSKMESQSRPPTGAIGEFEEWMGRFLSEDSSGRDQLIEDGVAVAGRRREEMKRLIQEDPETALALAVPYQFRREFPPEITTRLETPVSNFAQFQLNVSCSDPGHAEEGHAESEYERIAKFGGNQYEVHTFGRRFNVTTKDLLSIHGIAIDEVLAMADDPVRVLSETERADRGFAANIAVAVGGNVYGAADEVAEKRLRTTLEEDEGSLGPLPAAGYRALQREEVEGVSLLFSAEPDEEIDFAGLSEMESSDHTLGPKTMLYIRVRFSDQAEDFEPIDLATLRERQALCEAFWYENSYGKSSLTTTYADTITLPESANYYENDQHQLFEHGLPLVIAAGEAKGEDWDPENYDFHTVLTPDGNWGSIAGRAAVGGKSSQLYGPDSSNVRTASHEFGHNLGLWHANYWRTDATSPIGRDSIPGGYVGDEEGDEWIEYGHRFSVMSAQAGDGYLNEGRGHYTTGEKVHLDWLVAEDGDWMSVDQTTGTPIRLYRHDVESEDFGAMSTGVVRAIKINLDSGDYTGNDKRRYWLSYRQLPVYTWTPSWYPDGWPPNGLQVDWQRETYGYDGSILLDMTPYTRNSNTHITNAFSPFTVDNRDKEDGVLVIGRTYSDEVADIHFTPIAQGGENPNEWIDVLINIGTQDENTAPEITSFTASSTSVAEGEFVDFSVEAEDKDGDALYYSWTFGDNSSVIDSLNSKTAIKSWRNNNIYTVRVTVSDGKGGSDSKEVYVEVGDVSDRLAIRGRATSGSIPVERVLVKLYSQWEDEESGYITEKTAWTDGDGRYALVHYANTESWISVAKDGFSFKPLFSNPVYLTNLHVTGRDWVRITEDSGRVPVVQLTSPNRPKVIVPEGSGLFLEAEIYDENIPNSSEESKVSWSVLEAPKGGAVTFSPPHGLATVATFNVPGIYAILISATNDGVNMGTTEISVKVGLNPEDKPSSEDLVVYLTMDEGEGTTVKDSRGGDNNGHLLNGATWTGPGGGISGTGVVLDGIDDEIQIGKASGIVLVFIRKRTISLWFKADDPLRKTKQVIYHEGDLVKGLNIYLEAGRLYVGGWLSDNYDRQESFFSTELVDTNWHHVALTLDTTTPISFNPRSFIGYLDGVEFGRGQGDKLDLNGLGHGNRTITLGANRGQNRYHDGTTRSPGDHFAGILDEFHLWNRNLTMDEIVQLVGQHIGKAENIGPELSLSSVDHSAGSVVVPPGMGIVLDGSAKGDGSLETKWETVIAPEGGQAIFENSSQPSTVATFSTPGYYKLRLSADNGLQKSAIDVDVHAGLDAGSNFQSPQEAVYYSMDEGSGEMVRNSVGDHYHGEIFNYSGMVSEIGGISGTALQLNGIHNGIFIDGKSPLVSAAEKKSFALWIKPDETRREDKEVILVAEDYIHSGFTIYLDGNLLYFGSWNEWLYPWRTFLPVPINRGRWHHLALVLDADYLGLHPNGLKAYLNGKQVASGLASGVGPFSLDSHSSLGRTRREFLYHDGPSRVFTSYGFAGIIDEFHFYQDHALTIDEIGMLYAFGNVGPTVDSGPDQLDAPAYSMVHLEGSSTDDGRWSSPVTHSWHILDGPGDGSYRLLENNGASAEFEPLIPGSYRIALGAYDGQVTTFDELMVTVKQPTPFERYMHGFPAIAVEDRSYHSDPDRDNWSNLVEYAFGGAPDVNETYFQLGLKHELVMEAGYLYPEFRYPRRRDAAQRGLKYEFEVSDDLSAGSWTRRGFYVLEVIPIDEIFEEVRLTIADPIDSANSRIFGRVRVIIEE